MAGLDELGGFIPSKSNLSNLGFSAMNFLTWILLLFVFIILVGVIVYLLVRNMKFNKKIIIWEKIGNNWQVAGRDRAMELKFGKAGDTVFYLRKRKKTLPRPELQTGKRTYWFAIREDGEWINITMEDIDFAMKKAKAKFLHPEMRYARTALLGSFKERYEKQKFMEKYGHIIIPLITIIICGLLLYFLADKILTSIDKINGLLDAAARVMEKADAVLQGLDRVCTGSGIKA